LQARYRASAAAAAAAAFALALALLVGAPLHAAGSTRTLTLYNIHTKETVTATYKKDGRFVPAEMVRINWILRDWRRDEPTTMDPQLIDLLWEIHSELGSKAPIHIISGYRSRATNDMLRRTVGGQASQSRHILGKAADVHFPDVPLRKLRYSALVQEKGGVGYYPTSAIPFVHVDIDRPRSWPRLPRAELALLFPSGRTQHLPADGDPIDKDDVREARWRHKELAEQVAAFHAGRGKGQPPPVHTASLIPPLPPVPKLLSPPKLAQRPPSAKRPERQAAVVTAPAYDEEHPEELSYRPFPIAPFLTATASVDDSALAVMVHPDLGKVLEVMDQEFVTPPLRLRPGQHEAQRLWAREIKGEPVDLSMLSDTPRQGRRVATQPR
jgi:uncharacterized protein YcbK (DUF882 family)